jgi:hypothetical protein
MKKITTILLMLIVSISFSQNNPIDFEAGGFGADWTWTVFENGPSSPPLEIIANPDASGINTSATVAKFTAKADGNPWAGVESQQGVDLGTFTWSEDNRIVKIMVWKPVISDVGIKFATETGWAELELKVPNTVTNQWEELTFDFSNAINPPNPENGTLGQIIVFPDFASRTQDNIVYFDNITFSAVDDEPTDGPEVAAPAPPARDPEDVVSVFSDAYTDVAGTNFNPGWGQSTQVSFVDIEGNETMKYASFNYQGIEFASALNVTEMETLHLDMWTADATSVNIFLISTGPVETAYALPITPNQWVSYDIPLTAFTGVNLADVIQFKFDGGDASQTLYLDNLYFYKENGEEGTDASLSDLQVDGTTVNGFSPSVLNYSIVLPEGTTDVPVVTATTNDPEASAVITPADAIPGTTSILVTSANTEVERTYTVAFSIESGTVEGPRNPIDFEPGGYGADWTWTVFENGPSSPPLEIITNPDPSGANTSATVAKFTAKADGNPWAGVESQSGVDLGTFTWSDDNRIVKIMVWKPVISDVGIKFATETGWAELELKVPNTVTNQWEELTFDFSNAINPPNPENGTLGQIIIFPDFADRDQDNIVYFDNITFNAAGEEGTDASLSDLQVDGTTVAGFAPSVLNYSVVLPEGTTVVPTVTATTNDPEASAVVTPAGAIPGTTSILVTSANTEVERTYTVAFSIESGTVEGPRNPIDFEPGGYGADWTWTVFENETNPPLEIISNPDPSGINTSATVAKFTALQAGNPWAGVESEQGVDLGTFEWDDDNRIVKIHVWKPVISDVGIKFATETGWAQVELKVSNTLTNQWEELTFDFSDYINPPDPENGTLGQIIIFPDFDLDGREQDNIVYFDNITFGEGGVIPSDEPETAAPAPPARNPEDVISIFSEAYTNVADTDFNPDWGQSTMVSIIEIEGNETLKYANFNYQGTDFAEALDVSAMEFLHLDMWTADATAVNIFCISPGPEEVAFALPITTGQWVSYDIPLSAFDGVDLSDLIQFKFDGGDGSPTLYLDNLYFYKLPTSVVETEQSELVVYPNPVRMGSQVHLSSVADLVEVYDLTGKLIISYQNTSVFNTDAVKMGVYIIRIHTFDGLVQTKRLVVN